jgi:diguanylate cyclase (GGDEF)-like protein/PAS domain S-box-containing protein
VHAQGQAEFEDGKPVRLVGAFQDITERKQLEQRLAESERFVRQVTDSLPVRIAYLDTEARYRFVNLAHSRFFGLPRESIIGRTHRELTAGAIDEQVEAAIAAVLAGREQRLEFEEVVEGKTVRIESRLIPDPGSDGRVRGFYATGVDITERSAAERALRELTTIFDNTTDYVVQVDARGLITYMNPAVRKSLGIGLDESMAGRSFTEFNTPETNRLFAEVIVPATRAHGVWIGNTTVYADGQVVVPVNQMVIAHRGADGRASRYSAIMRDISDEVRARQEQERQAATLRSITEALPAIVAVVGADGRYRFVNSAFERWVGSQRSSILGRSMVEVLGRTDAERCRPWVERVLAGETVNFERDYPSRSSARHLAFTYIPMWLDGATVGGFVGVAQDITHHKQEEGRLLRLSQRDALTGLLNRSGFEQYLRAQQGDGDPAGSPSLALLYIDLDHFKPVNDTHGHPVGDQVLQQFAQRLQAAVRPTDAVARLGGDEFAIALSGVRESAHAHTIADKVIAAASMPFEVGALTLHVGASVGVAFGGDAGVDWQELVARADAMLYQAKASGRGRHAGAA